MPNCTWRGISSDTVSDTCLMCGRMVRQLVICFLNAIFHLAFAASFLEECGLSLCMLESLCEMVSSWRVDLFDGCCLVL